MYVITYHDLDSGKISVEGIIKTYDHFPKWLESHNQMRRENSTYLENGELKIDESYMDETRDNFTLTSIELFNL
jgi:hypothetical protein